jgi:hypothetical protein
MSAIPEPFAATRRNSHGRCDIEDQSHSATMKHSISVAQLSRHSEAHNVARLVRIAAGRLIRDRLEFECSPKDGIVALECSIRAA